MTSFCCFLVLDGPVRRLGSALAKTNLGLELIDLELLLELGWGQARAQTDADVDHGPDTLFTSDAPWHLRIDTCLLQHRHGISTGSVTSGKKRNTDSEQESNTDSHSAPPPWVHIRLCALAG